MSTDQLERALGHWRRGDREEQATGAKALSVEDALAYKGAGNMPDSEDRSLRLVLFLDDAHDLAALGAKRLQYEPDMHERPTWRRSGSKPINIVPLRRGAVGSGDPGAWWADPDVGPLEEEWRAQGTVAGIRVPGEYRGFVFKTVISLRAAGKPVSAQAIADSIARWLGPEDSERVRRALMDDE